MTLATRLADYVYAALKDEDCDTSSPEAVHRLIREWSGWDEPTPWYERGLPPIPTKTEAQRAYGRFGDTWWACLLSGGASATGAELRFRKRS